MYQPELVLYPILYIGDIHHELTYHNLTKLFVLAIVVCIVGKAQDVL